MTNDQAQDIQQRNYSTISPSAKALILLKGHTDIPYAKAVAELVSLPEDYEPDFKRRDFTFWARTVHLEGRYRSINTLLKDVQATNILELSSGLSFRGLDVVRQKNIHYIDTDLFDLIATKRHCATTLQDSNDKPMGTLEILPLNALDEQQFAEVVSHFPAGEVAIVNEGLLMYLDMDEKIELCGIIRDVLKERGGCWITADVYIKTDEGFVNMEENDKLKRFLDEHNVEQNKFESFAAAEEFFNEQGFVLDKEAPHDHSNISSLKYLLESISKEQLMAIGRAGKIQATWRLRLK